MSDETLTALRKARAELELAERLHFRYGTVSRRDVEKARSAYLKARDAHTAASVAERRPS